MLLLATLSCLVTIVLSSQVPPAVSLGQMDPEHACLFLCNICFPSEEDEAKLIACSNNVCENLSRSQCAMDKFLWLGHHCRQYEMVESLWRQ
ncbi:hypothetical protein BsWGS_14963 [Bradybaena similaris]